MQKAGSHNEAHLSILYATSLTINWQRFLLKQRKRKNGSRNVFRTEFLRKNLSYVSTCSLIASKCIRYRPSFCASSGASDHLKHVFKRYLIFVTSEINFQTSQSPYKSPFICICIKVPKFSSNYQLRLRRNMF